ncbi:MAG: hypothetical protein Q7T55_17415, partial [Solirubrobacteraceae bacterium]|nr:hypothetical protein [Solirubrobacteraceae bacterium]
AFREPVRRDSELAVVLQARLTRLGIISHMQLFQVISLVERTSAVLAASMAPPRDRRVGPALAWSRHSSVAPADDFQDTQPCIRGGIDGETHADER